MLASSSPSEENTLGIDRALRRVEVEDDRYRGGLSS